MRTIREAEARVAAMLDCADWAWRRTGSVVRLMTDEERTWALHQSIRVVFVELYGREDGERRFGDHMAAAERGALQ